MTVAEFRSARVIAQPDRRIRRDHVLTHVAVITGAIFVSAGLVKFTFLSLELHAFRSFGLPWPSALEILAGVLETAGGILLAACRLVVPVAALLGAVDVSDRGKRSTPRALMPI
jgi:uncharacterized membrane protein YphA (DoxX/SURF4 family)